MKRRPRRKSICTSTWPRTCSTWKAGRATGSTRKATMRTSSTTSSCNPPAATASNGTRGTSPSTTTGTSGSRHMQAVALSYRNKKPCAPTNAQKLPYCRSTIPVFRISTKIGFIPPTKHSTAITIRIRPMRRIMTLLPVSPSTLTKRVEARRIK